MSGVPKNYLWSAQSYVLFMTKRAYMTLLVHPIHARRFSLCDLFMIIISLIPYKSVDRSTLNELKKQQGDCDEILIIRDNHLTDTSYTNVALYDGQQWFTPSTPLLPGTMRQSLLDKGILQEREILVSDIPQYQQISLFNAMMELGEVVLMSRISYRSGLVSLIKL